MRRRDGPYAQTRAPHATPTVAAAFSLSRTPPALAAADEVAAREVRASRQAPDKAAGDASTIAVMCTA